MCRVLGAGCLGVRVLYVSMFVCVLAIRGRDGPMDGVEQPNRLILIRIIEIN